MTAWVNPYLTAFANWLSATHLSNVLGSTSWAIPVIQSIHIVVVALTMVAMAWINLRVIGVFDTGQTRRAVFARYLPWIAWAFPVLLFTGLLMITAEPTRAPFRYTFWAKMALIAGAWLLTWVQSRIAPDRAKSPAWAKALALVAILMWVAVAVCGRWIGYSIGWPGSP